MVADRQCSDRQGSKEKVMAEVLVISANLHAIFTEGETGFEQGDPWYKVYADYAEENGFHPDGEVAYGSPATRAEVASILVSALPPLALSPINSVENDSIPDVKTGDRYADCVYMLYRAGVLTGVDAKGAFFPEMEVSRAQVATIAAKIASPDLRTRFSMANPDTPVLTAVEIAEKCTPAVFLIEIFNNEFDDYYSMYYASDDEEYGSVPYSTGSGFFITSDGIAVTNHHVIVDADRAVVVTTDGERYEIEGIYSTDADADLAIIKVAGTGFSTLELGNSDTIRQGDRIYIIGSPLGYDNTFSEGIISNTGRDLYDNELLYIQSMMRASRSPPSSSLFTMKSMKELRISVGSSGCRFQPCSRIYTVMSITITTIITAIV